MGVVPQNSNQPSTQDASGRALKIRNRLVPVGDPMFRNFAHVTANCRGFCDEGLTLIEHLRNVVGL